MMLKPQAHRPLANLTVGTSARWLGAACLLASLASAGCGDDKKKASPEPGLDAGTDDGGVDPYPMDAGAEEDAGPSEPDKVGPLEVTTTPDKQTIDLFGVSGHRLWFDVDKEQLQTLNEDQGGGGVGGDIYSPNGGAGAESDHLAVQDKTSGAVADYGKVEIKLVGESTRRQWSRSSIPNVHVDMDEFEKEQNLGGIEHFRLNNGQVGSIFREAIAHRIYRELGYPALRSSFAHFGSSVWGKKTWIPMTLIEVYKLPFCDVNKARLGGGGCTNIWEFPGDVGGGGGGGGGGGKGGINLIPLDEVAKGAGDPVDIGGGGIGGGGVGGDIGGEPPPVGGPDLSWLPGNACQIKNCDNQKMLDLTEALAAAPDGAGFKQALDPIIDWQRYHEFQCLSWILWTGDDALHNTNNNLIIEQSNGKLMWAPYSVDISAGQSWYLNTPLPGTSSIATRCQADAECWADTIAVCEDMIARFDALDPERFVDEAVATLTDLEMMRDGDEARAKELRDWYVWRQGVLTTELEQYRDISDCGGGRLWCESSQRCYSPQFESCTSCPAESPLFCGASGECVVDWSTCDAVCESQQTGNVFCVEQGYCTPASECKVPDFDGGVIPDGDGGGIGDFDGGVLPPK